MLSGRFRKILLIILVAGVVIRFLHFHESVYFGYDEARDAYVSRDIYIKGDLKLLGPQASAFAGIHHGPLYYYLLGPLFIVSDGDPYFVSVVFRLLNSIGIVGIFAVGTLLFSPLVGLLSALLYAVSYEQFIYAIFTGNPSLSNISWIVFYLGVALISRRPKRRVLGLFLLLFGASLIPQFDLILGYSLLLVPLLLLLLRDKLKGISLRQWIAVVAAGFSPLYTYVLAEIKNNFLAVKTAWGLIASDVSIVAEGKSELTIFYSNFLELFRNNVIDLGLQDVYALLLFLSILSFLLYRSIYNRNYFFVFVWIMSFAALIFARGFMPLYSYAGVGIGLLLSTSIVIAEIFKRNKLIALVLLALITISNVTKITDQANRALVVEIKAQPGMKLSDEIKIIRKTYEYSNGEAFTIRTVSMPYKIQTVWSYLYEQYGKKTFGYVPYLEGGNVEGFPGYLPSPRSGTTCNRFVILEPLRGIPLNLVDKELTEEDLFSNLVKEEDVGLFTLQHRKSNASDCHHHKP